MRRIIWPLAVFLLSGCAQQRLEEAIATRDQAYAVCRQIPDIVGNVTRRASCLILARDQYVNTIVPQDADLEAVLDAEQMKMAGEVDAGTLSIPDYRLAMARAASETTSEARSRDQQDRQARAANAAAILAAMPPQPVYQPQPYLAPLPRSVTCNSYGLGNSVQTTCQ